MKTRPATGMSKKSRFWSETETKSMVRMVQAADKVTTGIAIAAEHYGVSAGSITMKYYKAIKGVGNKREKRNSTKDYVFKKGTTRPGKQSGKGLKAMFNLGLTPGGRITLPIKDVKLDLNKGVIHLEY